MGHQCCSKQKVKKGLWSPEEDEKLVNCITTHGHGSWSSVPKLAGLQRCGKSCRMRWINYLRSDLKRGSFTEEEERTIIEVHRILGNRWAQIAKYFPGRTDNEVKNFWNSCIKKKLLAQGLDPNTHNLLTSRQKNSKKNNNNALKTTIIHRIPSNSSSLVFSNDHGPENIISNSIQYYFSSNNFEIQNLSSHNNIVEDFSNQCSMISNTNVANSVTSDINQRLYMSDQSSAIWNVTSLENTEELARTTVSMETEPSNFCQGEAEYVMKNMHMSKNLDSCFYNSGDEMGFGDNYSSMLVSGSLYGDMGLAIDDVAWGNC